MNKMPASATNRPVTVIRESGGNKIIQTEGSLGYQVWHNDRFFTFTPDIKEAMTFLDRWAAQGLCQ